MAVINKTMVGESLVGDGNEVAHIDLIMGHAALLQRRLSVMVWSTTKMALHHCWLLWHRTCRVSRTQ